MTQIEEIASLGISARWPSRESVITAISATTPWSMDQALAYNARTDTDNVKKTLPTSSYDAVGYRNNLQAVALALREEGWEPTMAAALGYQLFADQLKYFWHRQFRVEFPSHPQPLRTMNWTVMTETMAGAFLLGWADQGAYQGYLTLSSLTQGFQLEESYEQHHRRGHAFMLQLFSAWQCISGHSWPAYGYDEPIYHGILERWQDPDPDVLTPWLLAACDRHTHEAQPDASQSFHDFSRTPRLPLEILFLFRLRQLSGLGNPTVAHPLMASPFDRLPDIHPGYKPDETIKATLARVREDWPEFDSQLAFDSLVNAVAINK